jgi:hypothetical protein
MRAAFFAIRLPFYVSNSFSLRIRVMWAILVAWSRVAKGRHFPLDVVGGFVAGLMLGHWAVSLSAEAWAAVKYPAGFWLCLQVVALALVSRWRLEGTFVHLLCGSAWLFSLQYVASPTWVSARK